MPTAAGEPSYNAAAGDVCSITAWAPWCDSGELFERDVRLHGGSKSCRPAVILASRRSMAVALLPRFFESAGSLTNGTDTKRSGTPYCRIEAKSSSVDGGSALKRRHCPDTESEIDDPDPMHCELLALE